MKIGRHTGEVFAGYVRRFALAKGSMAVLLAMADGDTRFDSAALAHAKAAVEAGRFNPMNWAEGLSYYSAIPNEFLMLVRQASLLGRIPGAVRVPLATRIPVETTPPPAHWRGPKTTAPKPISAAGFDLLTLEPRTVSAIIIATQELLTNATRGQDAMLNMLIRAVAAAQDNALLDPGFTTSDDHPVSLTAAGTEVTPTGSTAAATADLIESMLVALQGRMYPQPLTNPAILASPLTKAKLSLLRHAQGGIAFPSVESGTLGTMPIITSNGAVLNDESPTAEVIAIVDGSQLLIAEGGGQDVTVSIAAEASVQLDGAPSAGAQSLVSLFQNNLIGLRVETTVNWELRRGACAWAHVSF